MTEQIKNNLTNVQLAYLLGRDKNSNFGGVSTHIYYEIETSLDIDKFELALNKVIVAQPMLRTIITEDGFQIVINTDSVPYYDIKRIDLSGVSTEIQLENLQSIRLATSHRVFPLNSFPMFEFTAVKISDRRHILVFDLDMLIADGSSILIMIEEILAVYGTSNIPAALGADFGDFLAFLNAEKSSNKYLVDKAHWENNVKNLPDKPDLPLVKKDKVSHPTFNRTQFKLEKDDWSTVCELAKKNNVSATSAVATAFSNTMYYWGSQKDILLNFTINGRAKMPTCSRTIGDYTILMPLAVFSDMINFEDYWETVKRIQNKIFSTYLHMKFDGIEILNLLSKSKELDDQPVLPVVFTSLLTDDSRFDALRQIGEIRYAISQTPQVYLDCQVMEVEGELLVSWDYVTEIFDATIISQMLESFRDVLLAISRNSNSVTHIFQPSEYELNIIKSYNDVVISTCHIGSLADQLLAAFLVNPNKMAIKHNGKDISYATLDKLSDSVAERLREQGVTCGDFVGVKAKRCSETIINIIGIVKAGAAYVPIDPTHPADRQNFVTTNSGCKTVIDERFVDWERVNDDKKFVLQDIDPKQPAYVIYTSGSTGTPKGVVISHESVCNTIADINSRFNIDSNDIVIAISSFCFDLSVYDIFGTLAVGATLVLIEDARNIPGIIKTVKDEHVTVWNTVPAIMELYIDELKISKEREKSIHSNYWRGGKTPIIMDDFEDSLRVVMLSGDWIPVTLPAKIAEYCSDAQIYSLGGATEAAIWSIYYPIDTSIEYTTSIPYGYPLANQKIYVLDISQKLCPIGVGGEIYIGGKGVACGYMNDVQKTDAAFIVHSELGRLYRTGDYGVMTREGYVVFMGRRDEQVKIRGHRIELGEIEGVLNSNPEIISSAVVVRKNQNNADYLCAYVVSNRGCDVSRLMDWCEQKLPAYMVPKSFVQIDKIPLTDNGKVDKKSLPEPDKVTSSDAENLRKPTTETEILLYNMWRDVLKISDFGIDDNFFEIGGDSIKAIHIFTLLQRDYAITVKELFENQTVYDLAYYLDANSLKENSSGTADKRQEKEQIDKGAAKSEYVSRYKAEMIKLSFDEKNHYSKIILTGATGYLGSHVLYELLTKTEATVFVIAYDGIANSPEVDVANALSFYYDDTVYNLYKDRIIVFGGDLSKPHFMLSDKEYAQIMSADCIINSAASVIHYAQYEKLFETNVISVKHIIDLATIAEHMDIYHISTTMVSSGITDKHNACVFTEYDNVMNQDFVDPNSKTKFEAEQLLFKARQSGLNVSILRIGNLTFDSTNGKFQKNIADNAFYNMLKFMFAVKTVPNIEGKFLEYTFVDSCSEAVRLAVTHSAFKNQTLHMINSQRERFLDFAKSMAGNGVSLEAVSFDEFTTVLHSYWEGNSSQDNASKIIANLEFFLRQKDIDIELMSEKTEAMLAEVGFHWKQVNRDMLYKMYNYGIHVGFFGEGN